MRLWKKRYQWPEEKEINFRASCLRDGQHTFKSVELAAMLGAFIHVNYPTYRVNLRAFDMEMVAIVLQDHVILGISLLEQCHKYCFKNRMAAEKRWGMAESQRISTLRPSTAYLMLQLAKLRIGELVIDSMCGVGTLPIIASRIAPPIFALGGDVDPQAMSCFSQVS